MVWSWRVGSVSAQPGFDPVTLNADLLSANCTST